MQPDELNPHCPVCGDALAMQSLGTKGMELVQEAHFYCAGNHWPQVELFFDGIKKEARLELTDFVDFRRHSVTMTLTLSF